MYLVLLGKVGKGLLLIHGWLTANHSCYIKCVTMRPALKGSFISKHVFSFVKSMKFFSKIPVKIKISGSALEFLTLTKI